MAKKTDDIEALKAELAELGDQRIALRQRERALAARIAELEPPPAQPDPDDPKTQYVQL